MKKTFLTKRNALLSSADVSWGVLALAFVILVLGMRLFAPNFFWYVFTPVFRGADALSTDNHLFFSGFKNTAELSLQNEKLLDENTALALENQALLQKEAGLGDLAVGGNTLSGIFAGVVARPPESPYDTLVLAEGADAGIALGMEAFGAGGVPIGVVSSVLANFSRVTLFSSPGMRTSGWVGSTNMPLIIIGSGAGTMSASLARSANIAVGDVVFAPGPGMLPIGKIARIDSEPSSPSMMLHITPALNLFSISWVVMRDTGIPLLGVFSQGTSTLP
jgi:cell shape-determining protein MreC